jgi:hypothetical protein
MLFQFILTERKTGSHYSNMCFLIACPVLHSLATAVHSGAAMLYRPRQLSECWSAATSLRKKRETSCGCSISLFLDQCFLSLSPLEPMEMSMAKTNIFSRPEEAELVPYVWVVHVNYALKVKDVRSATTRSARP